MFSICLQHGYFSNAEKGRKKKKGAGPVGFARRLFPHHSFKRGEGGGGMGMEQSRFATVT